MICQLKGVLVRKEPTEAVLDVKGVGYRVDIPVSTFEAIGDAGREITLLTHLVVRDDSVHLYGFSTEDERELFELFTSVSGIGPKIALSLLSKSSCDELRRAISQGDLDSLTAVSGVGKKTAQRLVVELKDKVGPVIEAGVICESSLAGDAVRALMSLGYTRTESVNAVKGAVVSGGAGGSVEELVRKALAVASK